MPSLRLTIAQKIAAGYLLIVIFCLAAIVYALTALSSLTHRSEQLVVNDFRALVVARDLSASLVDQERLERQILILHEDSMLPLLDNREAETARLSEQLSSIVLHGRFDHLQSMLAGLDQARAEVRAMLQQQRWDAAEQYSKHAVSPLRDELFERLQAFRRNQENLLNETLHALNDESNRAFRLTLSLSFGGIGLAALVAMGIILKIHRAVTRLTQATRAVAEGSFDYPVGLDDEDEFGLLARDFSEMEQKLREMQKLHLDANPLTRLPGNLTIDRELACRIASGRSFAHIYVDLDYFKAYNDRYGYQSGSVVIAKVGTLIKEIAERFGNPEDLIGHIGGDDYVLLSTPDRAEVLASELIKEFDAMVPGFYSEQDRAAGFFKGQDRYGVERTFPLLSMSIAIVCSENLRQPSAEAIGRECAKIKEHLKKLPGSNVLLDRREMR